MRMLDPAFGGAAFLAPVALRVATSLKAWNAKVALESIQCRLTASRRCLP